MPSSECRRAPSSRFPPSVAADFNKLGRRAVFLHFSAARSDSKSFAQLRCEGCADRQPFHERVSCLKADSGLAGFGIKDFNALKTDYNASMRLQIKVAIELIRQVCQLVEKGCEDSVSGSRIDSIALECFRIMTGYVDGVFRGASDKKVENGANRH